MGQTICAFGPDFRKGSDYLKWKHAVCVSYLCIEQHIEDMSLKTLNPERSVSIFLFQMRKIHLTQRDKEEITYPT